MTVSIPKRLVEKMVWISAGLEVVTIVPGCFHKEPKPPFSTIGAGERLGLVYLAYLASSTAPCIP